MDDPRTGTRVRRVVETRFRRWRIRRFERRELARAAAERRARDHVRRQEDGIRDVRPPAF